MEAHAGVRAQPGLSMGQEGRRGKKGEATERGAVRACWGRGWRCQGVQGTAVPAGPPRCMGSRRFHLILGEGREETENLGGVVGDHIAEGVGRGQRDRNADEGFEGEDCAWQDAGQVKSATSHAIKGGCLHPAGIAGGRWGRRRGPRGRQGRSPPPRHPYDHRVAGGVPSLWRRATSVRELAQRGALVAPFGLVPRRSRRGWGGHGRGVAGITRQRDRGAVWPGAGYGD